MKDSPDPEELTVKTRYFVSGEIDKSNLQALQREFIRVLELEGYRQTDVDPLPFGPVQHTLDFRQFDGIPIEKQKSLIDKAKALFGISEGRIRSVGDVTKEEFLDGLERARDGLPFRILFHFKPYDEGDIEGYDIELECIPALLQKYRQLHIPDDYSYNTKDIVSQNKREVKRIMGRFALDPLQEPYTEAEILDSELGQEFRKHISSNEYGENILQYLDEGDTCFQRDLYHAALNCYIHAIEWTIITYVNEEKGKDIIDEQKRDDDTRYYFHHLINLLRDGTPVTQTTMESLDRFQDTERHWIAHHRAGEIPETRVEDVRLTLLNLIEELLG